MQSNPYVYPYVPFEDSHNTALVDDFSEPTIVTFKDLGKILTAIQPPAPVATGSGDAERIFSLFLDDEIRFGSKEFITDCKDYWIDRMRPFVDAGKPLQFTLLGFPYKVPVPIKTNRTLPDMGEVLALWRLAALAKLIKSVYAPGAKIHVFTEGGFGRFGGVSKTTADSYRTALMRYVEALHLNEAIEIHNLSDIETSVPDFEERYAKRISELKARYEASDADFLTKYNGSYGSLFRIAPSDEKDPATLLETYDDSRSDEDISPRARAVREELRARTHEMIFAYHAYLMVRDDVAYLEGIVPGGLALTVAPKKFRLGIIPISKNCDKIPYHSVVVRHAGGKYSMEYLIDVRRHHGPYAPVHLINDPDSAPFYYETSA